MPRDIFVKTPTDWSVSLEDGPHYTASALDALAAHWVTGQDLVIYSICAHCRGTVEISVKLGRIRFAHPAGVRVYVPESREPSRFFCSSEEFALWRRLHQQSSGVALTLEEALELGQHGTDPPGDEAARESGHGKA